MSTDPQRLLARLLARPANHPELIVQALTHRSAGPDNNERLEFLGDALLGLVIAEELLERLPAADEGELSRRRAALVNQDALAAMARGLQLGDYLRLGAGELRTGGHTRDSILADAFEALLGAIYLDQGFAVVRELVLNLYAEALAEAASSLMRKDAKTRLQEWLQARRRGLPEYDVLGVSGEQHAQQFTVCCRLTDSEASAIGEGSSRRRAEQQAAETLLALLGGADSSASPA
ncbi:MAG: ribonuclease III [Chromatiaceae bacterium]|nr:MAG: ribonuclease III [Chromatiaceae bacterium]